MILCAHYPTVTDAFPHTSRAGFHFTRALRVSTPVTSTGEFEIVGTALSAVFLGHTLT